VPLVDDPEIPVVVAPVPGVVCAAELPGLDGYQLTISPARTAGADGLGFVSFDSLGVNHNDRELTAVLIDDDLRHDLICLFRLSRVLVLSGEHVVVAGDPLHGAELASVVAAVSRLCSRPARIARRVERLYRRFGGIASGSVWNTVDYHVALGTSPAVRIDWPRMPNLVTRIHVDTIARDDPFEVVDVTRVTPPPGVAVPLAISDLRAGRYVCVAATDFAVASACARLDRALPHLGSALPHHVLVTHSGVDVLFPGYEEQVAAIEPGLTLARVLAGPHAHAPGPYR
jgi:hypothetical protein